MREIDTNTLINELIDYFDITEKDAIEKIPSFVDYLKPYDDTMIKLWSYDPIWSLPLEIKRHFCKLFNIEFYFKE